MITREELIYKMRRVIDQSKIANNKKAIRLNYLSAVNINDKLNVARMLKSNKKFLYYQSY